MRALAVILALSTAACAHVPARTWPCVTASTSARWPHGASIHLRAELALLAPAQAAAATWDAASPPAVITVEAGDHIDEPILEDGVGRISFERPPKYAHTGGATEVWSHGGVSVEADVAIDATKIGNELDPEAMLLHELGHVLGLGHSEDPADVMFCAVVPGRHSLSAADVRALGAL